MLEHGKADAVPESPVFETYLEAHQEAVRRRQGGSNGMVTRVVRSLTGDTSFALGHWNCSPNRSCGM